MALHSLLYSEEETQAQRGELAAQSPLHYLVTKLNPRQGCFPRREGHAKVRASSSCPENPKPPGQFGWSSLNPRVLSSGVKRCGARFPKHAILPSIVVPLIHLRTQPGTAAPPPGIFHASARLSVELWCPPTGGMLSSELALTLHVCHGCSHGCDKDQPM